MLEAHTRLVALQQAGYRCQARAPHGGYCNNKTATTVYNGTKFVVRCKYHLIDGEDQPADQVTTSPQGVELGG